MFRCRRADVTPGCEFWRPCNRARQSSEDAVLEPAGVDLIIRAEGTSAGWQRPVSGCQEDQNGHGAVFECDASAAIQGRQNRKDLGRRGMTNGAAEGSVTVDQAWSAMMAAAQSGDRTAYEALLRDCVPHVKRVVRRSGVNPDRVDDVVQEVLLTVHRARQTYDPSRSFTAWLSAIAQRRAIDALRQTSRRDRREVSDPVLYEAYPDQESSPEEAWEHEGRGRQLKDAVADLPPGQREAVEALALRQLSLSEAATMTGKTKGALKVNLHRALKVLRARFDRTG